MPPLLPSPAARTSPPEISPVSVLNVASASIVVVPSSPSAACGSTPFDGTGAMQWASPSAEQPSPHDCFGPVQLFRSLPSQPGVHALSITVVLTTLPRSGTAVPVPYAARLPSLRAHTSIGISVLA